MDAEELLKEISADAPCGDDLEYDPDFGELERVAQGKAEQSMGDEVVPGEEPDWSDVEKRAVDLFSRSKDLRIGIYLARARLHNSGLPGFSESLELLRTILERYWDTVHPQLDADDNNDPTLRVNTIASLCDAETVLKGLRNVPLVTSKAFGKFSYRDITIANGEASGEGPDSATVDAAFMDCDADTLQAIKDAAKSAADHAAAIEQHVTEQVGAAHAPDLAGLRTPLNAIYKTLAAKSGQPDDDGSPETAGDAANGGSAPAMGGPSRTGNRGPGMSGQISSRNDVIRALDMICQYYARHEPSSPVPLLLRRAQRLVTKSFLDIVRDLVPDGVHQAETIRGEEFDESAVSYDVSAPETYDGGEQSTETGEEN